MVRAYSRCRVECRETTVDGAHDTLGGVPRSRRAAARQPRPRPCVTHPARQRPFGRQAGRAVGSLEIPIIPLPDRPCPSPLLTFPPPLHRRPGETSRRRNFPLPSPDPPRRKTDPTAGTRVPPVPGVLLFVRRRRSGWTCERSNRKNPPSTPKIVSRT